MAVHLIDQKTQQVKIGPVQVTTTLTLVDSDGDLGVNYEVKASRPIGTFKGGPIAVSGNAILTVNEKPKAEAIISKWRSTPSDVAFHVEVRVHTFGTPTIFHGDLGGKILSPVTLLAPMYTKEERWVADEIKKQLEQGGYPTYQPYTDGFEKQLFELLASNDDSTTPSEAKTAILLSSALNFYNIIKSDCCALVMDGRTPDEGSVFWAAVAFASGKPVVLYKSDYRTFMSTGDNSMVSGLSLDFKPVKNLGQLNDRVASQITKYGESWKQEHLPGYNRKLLELGKIVNKEPKGSSLENIVKKLETNDLVKKLIPHDENEYELSDITDEKVYCSGPLFCPSEIREMNKIKEATEEKNLKIYLPHRDGTESMMADLDIKAFREGAIKDHMADTNSFTIDVYQLVVCANFVINLNGRVPDDGAVSEAGMAFAMGMPCVLYKSDSRALFGGVHGFLHPALQMAGHLFKPTDKYDKIKDELSRHAAFIKKEAFDGKYSHDIHPEVNKVYKSGEKRYSDLQRMYK